MDVNTNYDSEESKLGFIIADTHAMQIVVVQHMVIDSFCRCSVLVDLLPFIRPVYQRPCISRIVTICDIYSPSI